jgi:hypothetical protein
LVCRDLVLQESAFLLAGAGLVERPYPWGAAAACWAQRITVQAIESPCSRTCSGSATQAPCMCTESRGEACQCGRLIANAILYYNSAILLRLLLTRYEASGNAKASALITQISPAAWRHILLNGHYTFRSDEKVIDLDAIVASLDLG